LVWLLVQILSGAASGFSTGMPRQDIVLATAISTAVATATMGEFIHEYILGGCPHIASQQHGKDRADILLS
jgi:hypothetical protein